MHEDISFYVRQVVDFFLFLATHVAIFRYEVWLHAAVIFKWLNADSVLK
jgi:hypothetical protein